MDYQELVKLFSAPRLERYLKAVGGDEAKAVELYYQQSVLCGQFSALISYFEVLFRNQVNNHLVANYDPQWLVILGEDGSAMDKLNTSHTFNALKEVRTRLNGSLTNDMVISNLSFGFWVQLFQPKQHRVLGNKLITIFAPAPTMPNLLSIIHHYLNQIRVIRNRISHQEAIIFHDDNSELDFSRADLVIKRVLTLTEWLGLSTSIYDRHLQTVRDQQRIISSFFGKK